MDDRSGGSEVDIAGRNSARRVAASRLPNAKLLDGDGGNFFWIANTRPADLNYLLGNGFSERVTAINQIRRAQGQLVGQVQALHIFRPQFRAPTSRSPRRRRTKLWRSRVPARDGSLRHARNHRPRRSQHRSSTNRIPLWPTTRDTPKAGHDVTIRKYRGQGFGCVIPRISAILASSATDRAFIFRIRLLR